MRSRTGSPRILSWRIASPQRSLLAAPPLDKGNEDSGNELEIVEGLDYWSNGTGNAHEQSIISR